MEDGECRGLSIGETVEEGTEDAGSESMVLTRWRAAPRGGRAVVDMVGAVREGQSRWR